MRACIRPLTPQRQEETVGGLAPVLTGPERLQGKVPEAALADEIFA